MKKMDYTVSGAAVRPRIEPLSKRAHERTPEPLEFSTREEAKNVLRKLQAEGFKFSGPDLIDSEQRAMARVRNRYYIADNDGQLTLSGEDWGPLDTVWEVGDVMPGRERNTGTEAIVHRIIKGDFARRMGCDIAFILKLRDIRELN
jgi:hypothetical protein